MPRAFNDPADRVPGPALALAAGIVVLGTLSFAVERIHRAESARDAEARRTGLLQEAAATRARLERELNATLYITSGLVGYVTAYDDLLEADRVTTALAAIYRHGEHVRNVAMAPDNVLRYVYPVAGNEAAVGLDYRDIPEQWPAVERAMRERRTVLTGPVDLVQGGRALIARTPVFVGGDRYWGLLSLVIDSGSLFDAAGLGDSDDDARTAVRWRAPARYDGVEVTGPSSAFTDGAVVLDVEVPGGAWELALAPSGEPVRSPALALFRWGGHFVALLLAVLVFIVFEERRRVARMALIDPLTGLSNRRRFHRRLRREIERAAADGGAFSLLYIDLDGFKEVNDRGGHGVGDRVLAALAGRMRAEVGRREHLARLGGDEFAMLLPGVGNAEAAAGRAGRLREAVRRPLPDPDVPAALDASIGVAVYPVDGRDAEALLRAADRAMYQAKHGATAG